MSEFNKIAETKCIPMLLEENGIIKMEKNN